MLHQVLAFKQCKVGDFGGKSLSSSFGRLSAVCCLLSAVFCLLSAVCCLLSTTCSPARPSDGLFYTSLVAFLEQHLDSMLYHKLSKPTIQPCKQSNRFPSQHRHDVRILALRESRTRGRRANAPILRYTGPIRIQTCALSTVCCLLCALCYLLSAVSCLLSAACCLPFFHVTSSADACMRFI
jgi:hypothetical protein